MLSLIQRILSRLQSETLKLFALAIVLLLIWGTLAPIGTLVWWLSQSAESLGLKKENKKLQAYASARPTGTQPAIDCYIVYLPGVGDFSANELTASEEFFLNRLQQLHPNCVTVRDVFPYSAANKDLVGQRFLAPVWRAAETGTGWLKNADVLVKIRNLWRFAISADERYGSIYNQGIATAILDRMNAVHPISQASRRPLNLILIGTSGGVQVALGAVPYLHEWLRPRLTVISAGGAFDGEAGFDIARVYHLHGQRDYIDDIPGVLFSSRWRWTVNSPFNQARRQGRYTMLESGPHAHDGNEGYFGTAIVEDKLTYVDLTLQQINQLPIWSLPATRQNSNLKP